MSNAPVTEKEEEPEAVTSQADSSDYRLPDPGDLLADPTGPVCRMSDDELKAQADVLARALVSFGIEGKVTEIHPGPVVTMYEFEPAPGVKVARIVNLSDDLALALKATSHSDCRPASRANRSSASKCPTCTEKPSRSKKCSPATPIFMRDRS